MRYTRMVILLLLLQSSLFAQLNGKYTFRHLDQSDGLLHNMIRGIGQDKRGFIWILTLNGLQRYDGSRFLNYPRISDQSSYSILHDSEMYMDTFSNFIWIYKRDEVQKLDLSTNSFSIVSLDFYLKNHPIYPQAEFKAMNNVPWWISEAGAQLKSADEWYQNFSSHPGEPHRNNLVIKDPVSGIYWTLGSEQIIAADPSSGQFLTSGDPQIQEPLFKQMHEILKHDVRIRQIMLDSYRNLWISTWKKDLFRYDMDQKVLHTYSLKDIKRKEDTNDPGDLTLLVQAMYEDRQKNVWLGVDYMGLLRYDHVHDDFDFITDDEKTRNGLKYNFAIYNIFQDRDDNIWVGTDQGISIFNPYHNFIQSIRHLDGNPASLSKHDINDVIETSPGEILVATWGGGITFYDQHWNYLRTADLEGPDEYKLVWCFAKKDDGTIWAGAQRGYIHIYDPDLHTITSIHPEETENSTITAMTKDQEGNILIGLYNGHIAMWNKKENRFYKPGDASPEHPVQGILHLFADQDHRCWGASNSGLVEFNMQDRTVVNVYLPDSINLHAAITFLGIERYNDSMLLVGSVYKGLYLFNTKTKTFSRLDGFDMPSNSTVFAIKKEGDDIWFTTNYDLCKWNGTTKLTSVFNLEPGTLEASFSSPRFYLLNDGRWVTNSLAEIICFDRTAIENDESHLSAVAISRMNVLEHSIYIDSFLQNKKAVILPYDKNFFKVEFAALNFSGLRQTHYEYRLEGVDKKWIYSTALPDADYTDLKPGHYTFEVKASDGIKSTPVTSFPIIIRPPWWGTVWFRLLSIATIGALIYFLLRKRIEFIRKQADLNHRMVEMEMMALRSQMNPHFIFNCLTSIDNLIQTDQKSKATDYLAKFALLIRAILENSKSNSIPCWKDLDALKLYLELESLRWNGQIHYHMQVEPLIQEGNFRVPPLVIQPFVENAIHHGLLNKLNGEKKLDIDVRLEEQSIKYTITDNGVGREQAAVYKKLNGLSRTPFGMQMTSERINLFNQETDGAVKITDLYDEDTPAGTKVEVWLTTQPGM